MYATDVSWVSSDWHFRDGCTNMDNKHISAIIVVRIAAAFGSLYDQHSFPSVEAKSKGSVTNGDKFNKLTLNSECNKDFVAQ